MADISLCSLLPKPFKYCANCERNHFNTEPSKWRQSWISPKVDPDCNDYWPIDITAKKK